MSLEDLARILRSGINKPAVTSNFRLKRIGAMATNLAMMILPVSFSKTTPEGSLGTLIGWAISLGYLGILGSLSAFAFRGGFVLRDQGIAVVNRDGSPASRLRTFSRGLLGWSPMILLGLLPSFWNKTLLLSPLTAEKTVGLSLPLWLSLFLLAVAILGSIWSIVTPERGPHDRIVGTYLVPR